MNRQLMGLLLALVVALSSRDSIAQLDLAEESCHLVVDPGTNPNILHWEPTLVPVLLRTDAVGGIQNLGGPITTFNAFYATLFSTNVWNEDGGASTRFYYAGTTDQEIVPGYVVIQYAEQSVGDKWAITVTCACQPPTS